MKRNQKSRNLESYQPACPDASPPRFHSLRTYLVIKQLNAFGNGIHHLLIAGTAKKGLFGNGVKKMTNEAVKKDSTV
jgi:hypothetical protein